MCLYFLRILTLKYIRNKALKKIQNNFYLSLKSIQITNKLSVAAKGKEREGRLSDPALDEHEKVQVAASDDLLDG